MIKILRVFCVFCLLAKPLIVTAATNYVTNTGDSGPGSLREAMVNAGDPGSPGLDTIAFQIPGIGPFTINLLSELPSINDPVIIDGTTQSGYVSSPVIELNGTLAGNTAGLRLNTDGCTVRGLALNRFQVNAISITGNSNLVAGNYIGLDVTGILARGNGSAINPPQPAILITGTSGNVIGGTNAADRNIISGGNGTGVYLQSANGNVVQGNWIGITAIGSRSDNLNHGIILYNSSGNIIGGANTGARNVISGNTGSGVYIALASANNVVRGNFIGTSVNGTLAVSNSEHGVTVQLASANLIGGTNSGEGNISSGNGGSGVYLYDASGNTVAGNLLGTDVTGKVALGNNFAGVTISGPGNVLGGLAAGALNVISGNTQDGIFILGGGASGNSIEGNFIGVDITGTNNLGNGFNGISINAGSSNIVGGMVAGVRNVISGNQFHGISINNAGGNVIAGNFIGTDALGKIARGNKSSGIQIQSANNTVGGLSSLERNIISGNLTNGVWLTGSAAGGNSVLGNFIGTDFTGTNILKNGLAGVGISGAPQNTIGGISAGAGNVISGNGDAGIFIIGTAANGNFIQGNRIGTDANGLKGLGNTYEGIYVDRAATNTIGGAAPGAGNIIAANQTRGVWMINSSWNAIQGNLIGLASDGLSNLGNRFHAVELDVGANNNLIGGTPAGAANRIAFSQTIYSGARIRDGATNNAIRRNAIFSNGGLGIDLGVYQTSPNDNCDGDFGANMLQNFPALSNAVAGTGTGVRGTLNSTAGRSYTVEFFANPTGNVSGYGDGQIFLGDAVVTTVAGCSTNFISTFGTNVPAGYVLTATATDATGNTSEFSAWTTVVASPQLRVESLSAQSLKLSWTNVPPGFVLKQTENLSPPIQWITVTNVPVLSSGQYTVILPTTNSIRFYTLKFE